MSKNVKSVLSEAIKSGSNVKFKYKDLNGSTSSRTVSPEEFVSGLNGDAVVAVDQADNGRRRFLINSITNLSA